MACARPRGCARVRSHVDLVGDMVSVVIRPLIKRWPVGSHARGRLTPVGCAALLELGEVHLQRAELHTHKATLLRAAHWSPRCAHRATRHALAARLNIARVFEIHAILSDLGDLR